MHSFAHLRFLWRNQPFLPGFLPFFFLFLPRSLSLVSNLNLHVSYFGALISFVWRTSSCKLFHTAGGYHHYCQSKYNPGRCSAPTSSHGFLNYTSQTKSCRLQKARVCVWTVHCTVFVGGLERSGVSLTVFEGIRLRFKSQTFIFCSLRHPQPTLCSDMLCLPVFAIFLSFHSSLWSRALSTVWALLHLSLGTTPPSLPCMSLLTQEV